jgi:hypothetical protein
MGLFFVESSGKLGLLGVELRLLRGGAGPGGQFGGDIGSALSFVCEVGDSGRYRSAVKSSG